MQKLMRSLLKGPKNQYVDLAYKLRNKIKWKKVNGVHLDITDELITKTIFRNILSGYYEMDENRALQETFTPGDILLELGTGIGFNSIFCAKINKNKVMTFEANPKMIPLIKKNMAKNNVDYSVRNEIAVSNDVGEKYVSFNIVEDFWASSSKSNLDAKIVEAVKVPTCNIHPIIRDFKPTYLLVDIEGGEEDIFDDCSFLVDSSVKKIMIEMHADIIGDEKCFEVMQNIFKAGYKLRLDGSPKNIMYFYK